MKVSRSEPGFVVSSVVHAGLLVAALVLFSDTQKFEDAVESVPVEVVTDAQLTQMTQGEKTARAKLAAPRVDKVSTERETRPHPPLAEAKKDTPTPPPPLRRLPEPGEDDAPPAPPKRVAALPAAPEPKAEPKEPKPEAKKAEPKAEPKAEAHKSEEPKKADMKPAPQPPAKPAAPPTHDDPREAEVIKPKPMTLEKPDTAKPAEPKSVARETPQKDAPPKEASKPAPKLDKDAVKALLKDAVKDAKAPEADKAPAKAESRLKVDDVAKLLASKKAQEKPDASTEGDIADKSAKGAKPKSGDESAPKSRFDAASISSMLSREAPQRRASTGEKTRVASLGTEMGAAPKLSASMEARIASYIHDHYHPCWASALSLGGATFAPVIEFHLSRDGALQGSPRLVNSSDNPVERARGEQAVQAVRRCSPMRIPPEFAPYYEEALREVTIRFQDAN